MTEAEARAKFGSVIIATIAGEELLFRPLSMGEALDLLAADECNRLEAIFRVCEAACLSDWDLLSCVMDRAPLAFPQVAQHLLKATEEQTKQKARSAKKLWRDGNRNLGMSAEALLAFKAYQGGEYSAKELAGALAVADWLSHTRGIFTLFLNLMKSLSKRG